MNRLISSLGEAAGRRSAATEAVGGGWSSAATFDRMLAVLRADHSDARGGKRPVAAIRRTFGLDETDGALLWIAAAADLDATVGLAYGQLRGLPGTARPSVALALELAGIATAGPEGFARLGPLGALRRQRLVEVSEAEPWLARQLSVPVPVAAVLAGGRPEDPAISRLRTPVVPLTLPGGDRIARAIQQGVPLVWVHSVGGAAGGSVAAGAFDAAGMACLPIDVQRITRGADLADILSTAAREAGLLGAGLLVIGADALAEPVDHAAFDALDRAAVSVVAVGARPWNSAWLPHSPLVVEAQPLTVANRIAVWQANLGEVADDTEVQAALVGLRLTPESIAEAARYARVLAATDGGRLSGPMVREAARRVGSSGTAGGQHVVGSGPGAGPTFEDLVLPAQTGAELRRLLTWARYRDEVAAFGSLRSRGRGIASLFTGSPGTGKTLAAHVIAEALSVDLFQVDLATVVDKYIGETEKNLEKVFRAAEALDVVLFFDEADALFGSRSEVKDARDRYANQEVAYLLQRMESFDGITILATNLRGNLDRAFSRRMSFIVHFPDPDPATRRRIWERHLSQLAALDADDPVDLDLLAESLDVAGGDIRNIVLSAAYDAVSTGDDVGMRHLVAAALREFGKLGRRVNDRRLTAPEPPGPATDRG